MDTIHALARRLGAQARGADTAFKRVTTDTRTLAAGDLFVALKGERFDGHAYLAQAAANGAVGALVSHAVDSPLPQVVVGDTLQALQAYATGWRAEFQTPVVAVTGSNGKTTTKQMLAAVCASRGPVLATQGNLNNHIGLPLTVLGLRAGHRTAVIEMGANHPGEIAALARIAQPDVAVVTQAGDAHLEGFGSRDGVARAKGELFAGLKPNGIAVINNDDAYAGLWKGLAGARAQITFGLTERADVCALNIEPYPLPTPTGMAFELRAADGRAPVKLPLPGRHNVSNALAAAACAVALGMDVQTIAAGLSRMTPAMGRLSWVVTPEGARLLDDTYNANPTSLHAGLEVLVQSRGRRILVLGDMGELGPDSERLHREAGVDARALGVEAVFTVGVRSRAAADGFGRDARHFDDAAALVSALKPLLDPHTAVLVKGSRSSRMERVVAALTGRSEPETH